MNGNWQESVDQVNKRRGQTAIRPVALYYFTGIYPTGIETYDYDHNKSPESGITRAAHFIFNNMYIFSTANEASIAGLDNSWEPWIYTSPGYTEDIDTQRRLDEAANKFTVIDAEDEREKVRQEAEAKKRAQEAADEASKRAAEDRWREENPELYDYSMQSLANRTPRTSRKFRFYI